MALKPPSPTAWEALVPLLLPWFQKTQRPLPWRQALDETGRRDFYQVWVSEIMLQQTQVETVRPYYQRWMALFPTAETLACADEASVLQAWEGLGYYSRARHLLQGVRRWATSNWVLPQDKKTALALPGVGLYTAGALLSLALGLPYAAVDGNVLRVLARVFALPLQAGRPQDQRFLSEAMEAHLLGPRYEALPEARPPFAALWNEALIELGALVCIPKQPRCEACPLSPLCQARSLGQIGAYPRPKAKISKKEEAYAVLFVEDEAGHLLVHQRGRGLLQGLWEFPLLEGDWSPVGLRDQLGLPLDFGFQGEKRHVFTHKAWCLHFFKAERPLTPTEAHSLMTQLQACVSADDEAGGQWQWCPKAQLASLPFATAFHGWRSRLLLET